VKGLKQNGERTLLEERGKGKKQGKKQAVVPGKKRVGKKEENLKTSR